jgi:hypothetical protein
MMGDHADDLEWWEMSHLEDDEDEEDEDDWTLED